MVSPAERPIRKDEVVLEDRGIYIESWLPERRSRRRPLVLVHGELGGSWLWERYLGYFAHRGWEGHAVNLRAHYWSDTTEVSGIDFDSFVFDVIAAFDHFPPNPVLMGHGMGGLIAMRAAEERRVGGLVLISPALPAQLHTPPRAHVIRDIPDSYGRELLGWQSLPEQLRRINPDLTIEDVLRVQHLMGRESGRVRLVGSKKRRRGRVGSRRAVPDRSRARQPPGIGAVPRQRRGPPRAGAAGPVPARGNRGPAIQPGRDRRRAARSGLRVDMVERAGTRLARGRDGLEIRGEKVAIEQLQAVGQLAVLAMLDGEPALAVTSAGAAGLTRQAQQCFDETVLMGTARLNAVPVETLL